MDQKAQKIKEMMETLELVRPQQEMIAMGLAAQAFSGLYTGLEAFKHTLAVMVADAPPDKREMVWMGYMRPVMHSFEEGMNAVFALANLVADPKYQPGPEQSEITKNLTRLIKEVMA